MAEKKEAAPVAKQTVALKYVGEGSYHGNDHAAANRGVHAAKGQVVLVSEAKADQLNDDFPKNWEKASAKDAKEAATADAGKMETQSEPAPAAEAPAAEAAPAAEKPAKPAAKGKSKGKK